MSNFFTRHSFGFVFALALACFEPSLNTSAQEIVKSEVKTVPAAIESVVIMEPKNSSVSFVGIHVGDDPKPRLGGFSQFNGIVKVDPANNKINSLSVDISVDSVWTEFGKLTAHLKSADFFDVEKFPKSSFISTAFETGKDGKCTVTGDLTLHGTSKTISFPAVYRFENGGLVFSSKFSVDRSRFGMNQMLSGVDKAVAVEIQIGKKTVTPSDKEMKK